MKDHTILITNDDGIDSPGLRAAAEAVSDIGNIIIAAPRHQQTGAGRGLTGDKNACLIPVEYHLNGEPIQAYHCDCSPALIVKHTLRTLFIENKPDLLVSGINYGENLGINVTSSGTVGAALEAASFGVPGIAVSKQTDVDSHQTYTDQDWSATAYFLNQFSTGLLAAKLPADVDVLKIDVPADATRSTPYRITKLARTPYYAKVLEAPSVESKIGDGQLVVNIDGAEHDPESDIYALAVDRMVSVTPLSLDLTSRVSLSRLQDELKR